MNAPQLFVKRKPIEVEAMRLDLDNADHVFEWIRHFGRRVDMIKFADHLELRVFGSTGSVTAHVGDWISHDEDGLFRAWLPNHFAAYYEAVAVDDEVSV